MKAKTHVKAGALALVANPVEVILRPDIFCRVPDPFCRILF